MKYLASFHTTLKVSRYPFRALAVSLWLLIASVSVLCTVSILHERRAKVHQELNLNTDQAQRYIQRTADVTKKLRYVAGSHLSVGDTATQRQNGDIAVPSFEPLCPSSDCSTMSSTWRNLLQSLVWFMHYWRDNLTVAYGLNHIFLIGGDNLCMASSGLRDVPIERDQALETLHQHIEQYHNAPQNERGNNLFWVSQGVHPGAGYFYALIPVYTANCLQAVLGVEQAIRMEGFFTPGSLSMSMTISDDNGQPLTSLAGMEGKAQSEAKWMQGRMQSGHSAGFHELVLKKSLTPSSLSIAYPVLVGQMLKRIRMLTINAIILNILTGAMLSALTRTYERRIFIPAENDAQQLREHEQFNRRIVASAPVGICTLRTVDGANILSNELAHNYPNMLTHEDRQRLTQIICGQQVSFVDVLTSDHANPQISFVYSRYRSEDVVIYVLMGVSARVKMEESLQEMAQVAEQVSQSKSMLLVTVSHEPRTPLCGIIGNLDLLQTKALLKGIDRLVMVMNNSSSLLPKIINDILDFSKIESEQLKIELREFPSREVMNHVSANYLLLMIRKQLGLYCFIEPNVPEQVSGDLVRLQQVVSNLLSNAIKFTDTGRTILYAQCVGDYLQINVCDTGGGTPAKEVLRLFDPFFQMGTGVQRNFQGADLGLAICEKLISVIDGDVVVETEPGIGSRFAIRILLYDVQNAPQVTADGFASKAYWLAIHNTLLVVFVTPLLSYHGLTARRHAGEMPDADDALLTDDEVYKGWQGSAMAISCRCHIDIPQERTAGEWLHSTATPHELLPLLRYIFRAALDNVENSRVLMTPDAQIGNDDDMMIPVVDNHSINRRLLAGQLGSPGYWCVTANDGINTLNVLNKQYIDIALSGVNMSNMDDYRLTQRIRQPSLMLPVIGVTANALTKEKQRCLELGADNCLSKPVTLDVLKQTLAAYTAWIRDRRK